MAYNGSDNSEAYVKKLHDGNMQRDTRYSPHNKLLVTDRSFQLATTDYAHRHIDQFSDDTDALLLAYETEVDAKFKIQRDRFEVDKVKHTTDYNYLRSYYSQLDSKKIDIQNQISALEGKSQFGSIRFSTPGLHTWQVPVGNVKVKMVVVAAQGGNAYANGGLGGLVSCIFRVTPLETLYLYVGGQPSLNSGNTHIAQYNASDVRRIWDSVTGSTLNKRLIVAGGGGNGGMAIADSAGSSSGGAGGYPNGTQGGYVGWVKYMNSSGGYGATQSSGGKYGEGHSGDGYDQNGVTGGFGLGGNGAYGRWGGGSGAGGAGWYGGGGGGHSFSHERHDYHCAASGGGGGSSYADSSYCTDISYSGGVQAGNGYIEIIQI